MTERKRSGPRGVFCPVCCGHRLHVVNVKREPKTRRVTRSLVCTACDHAIPLGVCCRKCGDARLRTYYTTHRGEATIRVKICRSCGNKMRSREVLESFAS